MTVQTRTDINDNAVYAKLRNGGTVRLTSGMGQHAAQELYEQVSGGRVLQPFTLLDLGDDKARAKVAYFAVRSLNDSEWNGGTTIVARNAKVVRYSERTYTTDTGAAYAWNRAAGSPLVGHGGGWVKRAGSTRMLGQGWAHTVQRLGHDIILDMEAGTKDKAAYRFQVAKVAVRFHDEARYATL